MLKEVGEIGKVENIIDKDIDKIKKESESM